MCAPITSTVYKLTFSHWARFAIAKKDFLPSSSIQAGTTRLLSRSTSVMPKRTRGCGEVSDAAASEEGGGPDNDCPICFEAYRARSERTMTRPFQCTHTICRSCDHRMRGQEDNRCPTCRAPRQGFTAAQAEPPADRFGPSIEEMLQESLPPELQGLFTDGAFADRLIEHARLLAHQRAGAQQTLVFHVQSPVEWGAMPHEIAHHVAGDALLERATEQESPRVHAGPRGRGVGERELTGMIPRHLVEAIIDVPSVSLAEWRRRVGHGARHGTQRDAPPTAQPQSRPAQPRRGLFRRSFGFATRAAR
jgi:hypothetical protein